MDAVLTLISHAPYLALFTLLLLGGIGIPVPEDTTLILSGFLISQELMRPVPAAAVAYAGLLIADSLLYSFGRRFGRAVVEHRRFRRFLPPDKLAELEVRFRKKGALLILFGRYFAGLRLQLFLASGILRMPYGKFLAADALAALVTVTVMIGIGYVGGNSLEVIMKDVSRVEHVAVVAVLGAVTVFLLIRYFRRKGRKSR